MKINTKKPTFLLGTLAAIATLISGFIIANPFERTFPAVTLFGSCSADNISGAQKVGQSWVTKKGANLIVQGWSADIVKKTVASDVTVQLVDANNDVLQTWVSKYDLDRPDVATAFGNPAMNRSGMNISLGSISKPGNYKLQLGSINNGQNQICNAKIELVVQ